MPFTARSRLGPFDRFWGDFIFLIFLFHPMASVRLLKTPETQVTEAQYESVKDNKEWVVVQLEAPLHPELQANKEHALVAEPGVPDPSKDRVISTLVHSFLKRLTEAGGIDKGTAAGDERKDKLVAVWRNTQKKTIDESGEEKDATMTTTTKERQQHMNDFASIVLSSRASLQCFVTVIEAHTMCLVSFPTVLSLVFLACFVSHLCFFFG